MYSWNVWIQTCKTLINTVSYNSSTIFRLKEHSLHRAAIVLWTLKVQLNDIISGIIWNSADENSLAYETRDRGKRPTVGNPVESISSPGSRRKDHWVSLFSTAFFLVVFHSHKSGNGWQALPLYRHKNFEHLLHIAAPKITKQFTLMRYWLPVPSVFCFCRWYMCNNVLYFCFF